MDSEVSSPLIILARIRYDTEDKLALISNYTQKRICVGRASVAVCVLTDRCPLPNDRNSPSWKSSMIQGRELLMHLQLNRAARFKLE